MQKRIKPVCLLIIDSFHIEFLSKKYEADLSLQNLKDAFPVLLLKSNDRNIDFPWNSFLEIGTGINDIDISQKQIKNSLSEVISKAGLRQLHIAETENYANLTYFFDGRVSTQNKDEDWVLVNNHEIDNYLNYPEMMTSKITTKVIREIERKKYDFIVFNYANLLSSDEDISKSMKFIDANLKKIIDHILAYNGALVITSNTSNQKNNNVVPAFFISNQWKNKSHVNYENNKNIDQQVPSGWLYDIAPTLLKIMGISKPQNMIGESLI